MTTIIEEQIEFIDNLVQILLAQRHELVVRQRKEALDADMILLFGIIKDYPGIDRTGIEALLNDDFDYNNKMTALVRKGRIVNMGTRRKPSWYAIGSI